MCRPRVAIIGSREQLCIHPEVSKKETNSEKVLVDCITTTNSTALLCNSVTLAELIASLKIHNTGSH